MMGPSRSHQTSTPVYKASYVLLIFLIFSNITAAWRLTPSPVEVAYPQPVQHDDIGKTQNLTDLLTARVIHEPAIFDKARQLVSSLNSAPTCNYLAAQRLITSCKLTTANSGKNSRELVTKVKQLYAVRNAVCETGDGGARVPMACQSLIPKFDVPGRTWSNPPAENSNGIEIVSNKQLGMCIAALQQTTQTWTSYSNNLQSAATICQSLRHEIEQQELLQIYRTMSDVADYVNLAAKNLSQSLAEEYSTQLLRSKVLSDLFAMHQDDLERQHHDLQELLSSRSAAFEKSLSTAGKDVERLGKYLNINAEKLEHFLAKSYQTAASGVAELSASVLGHTDSVRDMTLAIQRDLQRMDTSTLVQTFQTILNRSQQLDARQETQLTLADVVLDKQQLSYGFAEQAVHKLADMKADAEIAAEKAKQLLRQIEVLGNTIQNYTELIAVLAGLAFIAFIHIRLAIGGLALYMFGRAMKPAVSRFWVTAASQLRPALPQADRLYGIIGWAALMIILLTAVLCMFLKHQNSSTRPDATHHDPPSMPQIQIKDQIRVLRAARYLKRLRELQEDMEERARRAASAPPDL